MPQPACNSHPAADHTVTPQESHLKPAPSFPSASSQLHTCPSPGPPSSPSCNSRDFLQSSNKCSHISNSALCFTFVPGKAHVPADGFLLGLCPTFLAQGKDSDMRESFHPTSNASHL